MKAIWLNAVHFQLVWWAMVLEGGPVWVLAAILSIAGFLFWGRATGPVWAHAVGFSLIGYLLDAGLTLSGLLSWRDQVNGLPPPWLWVIWWAFSVSVSYSLSWCARLSRAFQVALGALAGPLAYAGAASFGAVTFNSLWIALSVMAVAWGVLFPVMCRQQGGRTDVHAGRFAGA